MPQTRKLPCVAAALLEEVDRIYRDVAQKRATTRYLHMPPLLLEPVLNPRMGDVHGH
jgi:hypothetical protein